MEFRLNFIIRTILNFAWMITLYFSIYLIFGQLNRIADWTLNQVLLLTSVYYFSNTLFKAILQDSINNFSDVIRKGSFDFLLIKPVNLKFITSLGKVNLTQLPRLIVILLLVVKFTILNNPNVNAIDITFTIISVILGIWSIYCMMFSISAIAFWKPRIWNIWAFQSNLKELSQFPSDVYKGFLRLIVVILPIAAFSTVPTKFLLGTGNFKLFIYTIVITIVFTVIFNFIWSRGLKEYESASS